MSIMARCLDCMLHLFHRRANRARVQVPRAFVADDVVEDFDAEMEYAEADTILDMKRKGDGRRYLVRWCISLPCCCMGNALSVLCFWLSWWATRIVVDNGQVVGWLPGHLGRRGKRVSASVNGF